MCTIFINFNVNILIIDGILTSNRIIQKHITNGFILLKYVKKYAGINGYFSSLCFILGYLTPGFGCTHSTEK